MSGRPPKQDGPSTISPTPAKHASGPNGPLIRAAGGGTATPPAKKPGSGHNGRLDAQQRWEAHVAPTITRLDQEIALHQTTLDRAANRFEHQHAASRAAIDHGLQQQRHSKNLAQRVRGQRDHLDGLPTDAEVRRAAVRREQLGGIARVPQHQTPAPASPGIDL